MQVTRHPMLKKGETPQRKGIFGTETFKRHWFVLMAQKRARLRCVHSKERSNLDHFLAARLAAKVIYAMRIRIILKIITSNCQARSSITTDQMPFRS